MDVEKVESALEYGVVDRFGAALAPGDCVEYWRDCDCPSYGTRPYVVLGFVELTDRYMVRLGWTIGLAFQSDMMSPVQLRKVPEPRPGYAAEIVNRRRKEER